MKEKADDGHGIVERTLAAGALARGTASEAAQRVPQGAAAEPCV